MKRTHSRCLWAVFYYGGEPYAIRMESGDLVLPLFSGSAQAQAYMEELGLKGTFVGPPMQGGNLVHFVRAVMSMGVTHWTLSPPPTMEASIETQVIQGLLMQAKMKVRHW